MRSRIYVSRCGKHKETVTIGTIYMTGDAAIEIKDIYEDGSARIYDIIFDENDEPVKDTERTICKEDVEKYVFWRIYGK